MKRNSRTLTLLIAVVLFVAYLIYWLLRMSSLPLVADAVLAGGVIAAVALGIIALWRGTAIQRLAASVVIGVVLCGLIFLGLNVWAGWYEHRPGLVGYEVTVDGLEGRTGGLVTTILVPLPVEDGEVLMPASELEGRTFDGWTTTIVGTRDGNMLAFQNQNNTLTDIQARFTRDEETIEGTKRLPVEHLSPVVERSADDRYATVIFVDEGISPPGELTVSLTLTAGCGLFHGMAQETYRTEVSKTVPPGTAGGIVVDAMVGKIR
ncbi:MAG: ABC transporter permease [Methanoculleus sp.]|nr:ABC transporter permease [Methanoculleus sp.]